MKLPSPPDPRNLLPSRAHPEHRQYRKQLEKEHPFSFAPVVTLGLIGLTLAWDMEKQVKKHEERKDKEEAERDDRERRRREKGHGHRETSDCRRDQRAPDSSRSRRRGDRDGGTSESYARDPRRHQSVDYRADPRRHDGYRGQTPRYDPRDDYRDNHRDDYRYETRNGRGRSRRDSF
ncbi:hypothetical protein GGR55DRAFT_41225 [Xylaria sp. FL0064]|nr:hypothetical protein GGR55DRAFT_41225 [Xylaria sp. FL0064]